LISRLTEAEIPVMGHVGLTPQSVNALGGYRVQGKTPDAAEQLIRDARAVEAAGTFAVVLEAVPRELAAQITRELRIPTIGIGAARTAMGRFSSFTIFWSYVWPDAEICAPVCQRRGNHREGREGILRRCARGTFPSDGESYHAAQMAIEQKEAPVNGDGDW